MRYATQLGVGKKVALEGRYFLQETEGSLGSGVSQFKSALDEAKLASHLVETDLDMSKLFSVQGDIAFDTGKGFFEPVQLYAMLNLCVAHGRHVRPESAEVLQHEVDGLISHFTVQSRVRHLTGQR